jgi:hypothetical protein
MFRSSTRRARLGAAVTAAIFGAGLVVAAAPAGAYDVKVHPTLFGMHDATDPTLSFSRLHEHSVRLWDVGVRWEEVETHSGGHKYSWAHLDSLVEAAHAAHASVTMVVAMTPRFYASSDTQAPRQISAYKDFVTALMKRYKDFHGYRAIDAYEVWNEANIVNFWTGSMHQIAQLTQAMWQVRQRVDRGAEIISAPMVARLPGQLDIMRSFWNQRVGGKPVWRYVDAIGLSLYPEATYGSRPGVPEDSMRLLAQARRIMHKDGVPRSKPIWNTEVNYGLVGGDTHPPAQRISSGLQAAYVLRTYLLNAAAGVKRVFWYRYDFGPYEGGTLANTLLADPNDFSKLTPAGRAYVMAQRWMNGTLLGAKGHAPCPRNRQGTYTCTVKHGTSTWRIYWNPSHDVRVKVAGNARFRQGTLGGISSVKGGSTITVTRLPVLVSHTDPSSL